MSYCRFGPGSDLYIYEDFSGGITIHVASSRHILPDDMPANSASLAAGLVKGDITPEEFSHQHRAYLDTLAKCPLKRIGLPRDGESFNVADHEEAARLVDDLAAEGYQVAPLVAAELRADAELSELFDKESPDPD
jgi:hypothetical protein